MKLGFNIVFRVINIKAIPTILFVPSRGESSEDALVQLHLLSSFYFYSIQTLKAIAWVGHWQLYSAISEGDNWLYGSSFQTISLHSINVNNPFSLLTVLMSHYSNYIVSYKFAVC